MFTISSYIYVIILGAEPGEIKVELPACYDLRHAPEAGRAQ
jgi:hypothetical protein